MGNDLLGVSASNRLRITGMASGLDVDGTIKKMLEVDKIKINRVEQDKQILTWKQDIYQKIISEAKEVQNSYFDILKENSMLKSSNFFDFNTKISDQDQGYVKAVAGKGAKEGTYSIQISRVAKSALKQGRTLNTQVEVNDVLNLASKTIKINGENITIPSKSTQTNPTEIENTSDVAAYLNNQISSNSNLAGKVSVSYIKQDGKEYIKFNNLTSNSVTIDGTSIDPNLSGRIKSVSSSEKLGSNGDFTITYKNETGKEINKAIHVDTDDSIEDVIDKIKQDEDLNGKVIAGFDSYTGKFSISTSKTGSSQQIKITGDKNVLDSFGMVEDTGFNMGESASVKVTDPEGTVISTISESNVIEMSGVTYTISSKTPSEVKISVTRDIDKTFNRINEFREKYNKLVGNIQDKISQRRQYDYKPLTEEQKKDMTEDQIKAWEEKAKEGILKNDDNLQRMLRDLRGGFFDKIENSPMSFNRKDLGLDTSSSLKEYGQIKFTLGGEEKLKKALKERPEDVFELFNKTYELTEEDSKKTLKEQKEIIYNNSGIFQRINNILQDNIGKPGSVLNDAILTKYANKQEDKSYSGTAGGDSIPDQIYRKDKVIKSLEEKMKDKQEQLYMKFSRLESVMNNYNSQMAWLSQQFGGGTM
ncbi:flagellar filament capping protein FliD [Clostridium sp. Marseille-Q2269]|uniref:flagellar filament capping protein FliD n=1 Tax=Clostridium sp. Marseille-Q2269 TaxID=2942205 RepID=UPI00207337F2|nr:flagellar filament capping protein FliD [Clostridium sp. Marseille-Q2269]